jgi:hypothetical protein
VEKKEWRERKQQKRKYEDREEDYDIEHGRKRGGNEAER